MTKALVITASWLGLACIVAAAWLQALSENPDVRATIVMQNYRMQALVDQAHVEHALAKLEAVYGAYHAERIR
ncbi:MAG: hypothetical protein ACRBM6_08750 [Geminicoccales bacterium]